MQNGVGILSGDKADIRYGTMKEGQQAWNNVLMLSKGAHERGVGDLYCRLANVWAPPSGFHR